MRPPSTTRAHRDKGGAFVALLDAVDQVGSLRGAQSLRHLAESAEDVDALLDIARMEAMALRELPDLSDALENLASHRDTLARLGELAGLADEIDHLARAIRLVHGQREVLEWAGGEDWGEPCDESCPTASEVPMAK